MFDVVQEQRIFAALTAELDLYSQSAKAYVRARSFRLGALESLSSLFDADMQQWLETARKASSGRATQAELIEARERVEDYRATRLGLHDFDEDLQSEADALTRLFLYSFDDWPDDPASVSEAGVFDVLDHFSDLFVHGFGRGRELAEILKQRFEL